MKKNLVVLIAFCLCCICMNATAQTKEIRVLVANHPYGDLLKTAIPEFEGATGIKVNVESLQESQLSTKLATEFATKSSSIDVFMLRPLQEGKMFNRNGWLESLSKYDFSDFPKNMMSVATFGGVPQIVPIVTEWEVLYYRRDVRSIRCRSRHRNQRRHGARRRPRQQRTSSARCARSPNGP